MNYRELQILSNDIFLEFGFKKNKSTYYKEFINLIVLINLQKSTNSNHVYFNIGYFYSNDGVIYSSQKVEMAYTRSRFEFEQEDFIDLDNVKNCRYLIEKNIQESILQIQEIGIKKFIELKPILLFQTTKKGIEALKYIK
jgi:hypothetical protein